MSYRGHIQHGMVVFDEPVPLPEGAVVRVEPAVPLSGRTPEPNEFWREQSIGELAANQGVAAARPWEQVHGRGSSLWDDDAQLEEFLRDVECRRREGMTS